MTGHERLHLATAVATSAAVTAMLFVTAGWLPATVIGIGAFAVGIVAWMRTSLRAPTDPRLLLPPYLVTAALLMVHIAEEYAFDFAGRIAGLTGGTWDNDRFLWSIGIALPSLWILGAVAIARRHPLGGFVSWFVFAGMLLGEPTHLIVFPVREALLTGTPYSYFPGMWTALLPLVSGVWGMWVVVTESRRQADRTTVNALPRAGGPARGRGS